MRAIGLRATDLCRWGLSRDVVRAIDQTRGSMITFDTDQRAFTCHKVVCTGPLNMWNNIKFDLPLSAKKVEDGTSG
ncbi:hypothetical protein BDV12DRAFT_177943 [Aspergillus spectabilis]